MRLAVTVRVLLHDTRKSASLLGQLGVKDGLSFVNTGSQVRDANGNPSIGVALAGIAMDVGPGGTGGAVGYLPLLGRRRGSDQGFDEWWLAPVIGRPEMAAPALVQEFSRCDAVLALAHQEGGAHVDPKATEEYLALRRLGAGFAIEDGRGGFDDAPNPALATVRQIAYEVELTIREQLPHLIT